MYEELTTTAENAVDEIEALDPGEPWASACDAADMAIDELRGCAAGELFPDALAPVGADVLRDLDRLRDRLYVASPADAVAAYTTLHRQALAGENEALAAALRGPRGLDALRDAIRRVAVRVAKTDAEAQAEEIEKAQRNVGEQLAGLDTYEPAATILRKTVPELRERLQAARVRHEEHAQAELDRVQAEQEEAARVAAEEATARRERLAKRLRHLPSSVRIDVPRQTVGQVTEMLPRHVARSVAAGAYGDVLDDLERQVAAAEVRFGKVPA